MATIHTRMQALTIAICDLLIARSNDNNKRVFMLYCNGQATTTIFYMSYCKGANNNTAIQTLQEKKSCGMIRKRNNQIFIAVDCKKQQQ